MQYGLLALILVQVCMVGACGYVYYRSRSMQDLEKHDRMSWSARIEAAYGLADGAKKAVEMIEVSHYKSLAIRYEESQREIESMRAKIARLEESVESLSNKLASRDRQDRALARADAAAAAEIEAATRNGNGRQAVPAMPDAMDVDSLVRQGMAIPLMPRQPAPEARRPSNFGRAAR